MRISENFWWLGACSFCLVMTATLGHAQDANKQAKASALEEIIVTARRIGESAQSAPVLVNAFDTAMLRERSISTPEDLQLATPGVYLTGSGGRLNVVHQIRGQSKALSGTTAPAVVSYFAEVPDLTWGAFVPQFDMASIQVLKGPQGTLFGRNTTGGAILYYPQTPDHELSGYLSGSFGNYQKKQVQGAANIPIVKDRATVRLAADIHERDGYTKNLADFDDMDNVDSETIRVSLLLTPTDNIRNVTIFDHYEGESDGFGTVLTGTNLGGFVEPLFGVFNAQLEQLALQEARGPFKLEPAIDQFESNERTNFINRTEVDFGGVQLVNIFGYRYADVSYNVNVDGTPTLFTDDTNLIGLPAGFPVDLLLADLNQETEQLSNELQLRGKAFDDRLNWMVGGFWLDIDPDGPHGNTVAFGHLVGIGVPLQAPVYNFISEKSWAVFTNLTYDLSAVKEGLEFEIGLRYSDDTIESCAGAGTNTADDGPAYATSDVAELSDCENGNTAVIVDTALNKVESDEVTWSVGLNWQMTDDLFGYLVARHGYRAGGVNGPSFSGRMAQFQTFGPETIDDFELGIRADWLLGSAVVRTNATVFFGTSEDVQTIVTGVLTQVALCDPSSNDNPAPISPDGDCNTGNDPAGSTFVGNFGEAEVWGLELELAIAPTAGLTLGLGYSYLDVSTKTIDIPPEISPFVGEAFELPFNNTAKQTLTANLRYARALSSAFAEEFVLNVDFYWTDDIHRAEITLPSYEVVNARASLNGFLRPDLSLSVFARNLFDEEYITASVASAPAITMQTSVIGPPQMFGAELRYEF